jgi:hypothetical protein
MKIPVLITYSNYGYIDFAKNLILNLANVLKRHTLHFYCLDKDTYDALSVYKYPFLILEEFENDVSSEIQSYGNTEYNRITHTKMSILRKAFELYDFIHFIDCDVVCLKEPTVSHYAKYRTYDIVFQYDYKFIKNFPIRQFGSWQCTGNMSMRKNPRTLDMISKIETEQSLHPNKNDQECLKNIFVKSRLIDIRGYTYCNLYVYSSGEYANGLWRGDTSKIYFFHANHVYGKEPKIKLLENLGQWFLPREEESQDTSQNK